MDSVQHLICKGCVNPHAFIISLLHHQWIPHAFMISLLLQQWIPHAFMIISSASPVDPPCLHNVSSPSPVDLPVAVAYAHRYYRRCGIGISIFYFSICTLCCVNVLHMFALSATRSAIFVQPFSLILSFLLLLGITVPIGGLRWLPW